MEEADKTAFGIIAMAVPAIRKLEGGAWAHPYYRGLVLRRHAEDLSDWVDRADEIYSKFGAKKTGRPPSWKFPSGAIIRTGHLRDDDAFTKYQGHEYQRMLIEEVQLIASEGLYERLLGSCRSIHPDLSSQIILTANPGGAGTGWVRARFVKVYDASGNRIPYGTPFRDPKAGHWRIYIPARLDDNPTLKNDPSYRGFLESLPPALRKAWLLGDWDAIEGAFFQEFRPAGPIDEEERRLYPWANHVIPAGSAHLEPWYQRSISGDWGYDHPSVFHWYCETPDSRIHVYRELYVRQLGARELGVSVAKASAADLARMQEPRMTLVLDPRAWAKVDDGKTVAQQIAEGIDIALGKGTAVLLGPDDRPMDGAVPHSQMSITVRQADNQRVAGWSNIREFLRWKPLFPTNEEILPRLQIWDSCPHLIDTLGILVFDEHLPEDAAKLDAINGEGGDDAADSLRYGLMAFKSRAAVPPMQVYVNERLAALNRAHGSQPDMTIVYMVAQHAEAQYREKFSGIAPVTFRRAAGRRHSHSRN